MKDLGPAKKILRMKIFRDRVTDVVIILNSLSGESVKAF